MPVDKADEEGAKMRIAFTVRQTKTGAGAFTKVFAPVNKTSLRDTILRQLRQELARQTSAAAMARDEAISEESRAENKWDTHSQEAAYLAEGQAKLAAEIGTSIELYETIGLPDFSPGDAIAVGAVVELETADSAFLCGTAAEIVGIESIDAKPFHKSWFDSLGATIQEAYKCQVLEKSFSYVII